MTEPSIAHAARPGADDGSEPYWYVDPELRDVAAMIETAVANGPKLTTEGLDAYRAPWPGFPPAELSDIPWTRRTISGSTGQPDVAIYIVNARPGAARGGIVHTHGGGYVAGSVREQLRECQNLAALLDVTIVSVAYRLAPETPWTGSTEDNYAALLWTYRHAADLGIDPARIAVMGESAGGGHAVLLAIAARDRGEVPLAFQCLVYPMLDDRTGSTRHAAAHIGTLGWTERDNRFGWGAFLGTEPGGASVPAQAVPARAETLAGLPPTWIGVGGIDLFVQEDIAFAAALVDAAVPVELLVVPGAFHGFDVFAAETAAGRSFNQSKVAALRRALAG